MENLNPNIQPENPEKSSLKVNIAGDIYNPQEEQKPSDKVVNGDGHIGPSLTLENINKIKHQANSLINKFNYAIDNTAEHQQLISTT